MRRAGAAVVNINRGVGDLIILFDGGKWKAAMPTFFLLFFPPSAARVSLCRSLSTFFLGLIF